MFYLASQSPRRKEILKSLKVPFRVVSSSYEEYDIARISPQELALEHARGKALCAKIPAKADWVIGSDTIVVYKSKKLGKPKSKRDAIRMLESLSGKTHRVYTAIAIWDRFLSKIHEGVAETKVKIKKLTRKQIENYIDQVHSYDKAGAYAIQEEPCIVTHIEGSYTNVVGFPVELFAKLLKKLV